MYTWPISAQAIQAIRGTKEEAARVAEEAKNHFESGRQPDGNSFSARHSRREYEYYEQFRGSS